MYYKNGPPAERAKMKSATFTGKIAPAVKLSPLVVVSTLLVGGLLLALYKIVLRRFVGVHHFVLDDFSALSVILLLTVVWLLSRYLSRYYTMLRQSQRELYENPVVNRLLFHDSNDAIFVYPLTPDGAPASFLSVNQLACQRLGYTPEEFRGLSLADITSPNSLELTGSVHADLLAGKPVRIETFHRTKDGRKLPVEVTFHLFPEKKSSMVLAIAKELTAHKTLEENWRKAEETLLALSRNSPLAIVGFDQQFQVTQWNEAAELMFGWEQGEVLGQVLPTLTQSDRKELSIICNWVLHGETLYNVKGRHLRKDGALIDVSMCLAPITAADRAVIGIMAIIADITERIRTDEELLRVNRALKVLSEAKRAIACSTDESALLHDICRILIDIGGYRFAWIGAGTPDAKGSIKPLAYESDGDWSLDAVHPSWRNLTQQSNPTLTAIRLGNLQIVKNLLFFSNPSPWIVEALNRGYGAVIALPVMAWQPGGALTIFARDLEAFDEEEVKLLSELADDIAYGVESLRLRDERQRVEDALLAQTQQWRSTFDAISDPVYVVNPAGVITQCNNALSYLLGIPYDHIVGRDACELLRDTSSFLEECLRSRGQETRRSESDIFLIGDRFYKITFDPLKSRTGQYLGSIQVMNDITEQITAERELKTNYSRLKSLLNNTITTIAKIVEMQDPYTAGHEHRVSQLACAIAREMDLSEEKIESIRVAGILHDIGKLYVPSQILSKPGALNETEFILIKMHALTGYETLKSIDFPWPVAQIVRQHHERINGSGYPDGLSGDDTLIEARILAVADVVESMSSHRPYRPSRGMEVTLQEIEKNSGVLYDAVVAQACRRLFHEQGFTFDDNLNTYGTQSWRGKDPHDGKREEQQQDAVPKIKVSMQEN